MISISSCVEFVRCQWKHRPGASCCFFLNLMPTSQTTRRIRYKQRIFTIRKSFSSLNTSSGYKDQEEEKEVQKDTQQQEPTARQNMCTEEVLRMRRSLARSREVSKQHAGARQHDRGHAKVGSTSSSFNTIQTVEERAARACRAEVASGTNATQSTDHPKYSFALRLKPKFSVSPKAPDSNSRERSRARTPPRNSQ